MVAKLTMESDIKKWILERLSINLPEFNNMPACPFAKQALLDEKVKIIECSNLTDSMLYETELWPKNIEVIVFGINPNRITSTKLTEITEIANNTFLRNRGLIGLEDYPTSIESIAGYNVNEGNWALILVQSLDKLKIARKILEKRGYYKNWDLEYYKEVVLDRS